MAKILYNGIPCTLSPLMYATEDPPLDDLLVAIAKAKPSRSGGNDILGFTTMDKIVAVPGFSWDGDKIRVNADDN